MRVASCLLCVCVCVGEGRDPTVQLHGDSMENQEKQKRWKHGDNSVAKYNVRKQWEIIETRTLFLA